MAINANIVQKSFAMIPIVSPSSNRSLKVETHNSNYWQILRILSSFATFGAAQPGKAWH